MARSYARCYDFNCVILRFFNVFGPRQRSDSPYAAVIPRWISTIDERECPVIYGDGTQTRDFTPVNDVVQANLLAGSMDIDEQGPICNIASGMQRSLLDVLSDLSSLAGREITPVFEPERESDVLHSHASIDRASMILGFHPGTPFREALAQLLDERSGIG